MGGVVANRSEDDQSLEMVKSGKNVESNIRRAGSAHERGALNDVAATILFQDRDVTRGARMMDVDSEGLDVIPSAGDYKSINRDALESVGGRKTNLI